MLDFITRQFSTEATAKDYSTPVKMFGSILASTVGLIVAVAKYAFNSLAANLTENSKERRKFAQAATKAGFDVKAKMSKVEDQRKKTVEEVALLAKGKRTRPIEQGWNNFFQNGKSNVISLVGRAVSELNF